MKIVQWIKQIDYLAWIATIALIVGFREGSVWICSQFDHPELGNLLGLILLLILLSLFRIMGRLPARLIDTSNKLMRESGFAFVPITAGAWFVLFKMGQEMMWFLIVLCIGTLIPMWVYAKMAKRWL